METKDTNEYIIVMTTVGSRSEGSDIAEIIISENLAACVSILPEIHSVYRWENEITEDSETLLLIKTLESSYKSVEKLIKKHHSYDVPEILSIPAKQGSTKYLEWIKNCVTGE